MRKAFLVVTLGLVLMLGAVSCASGGTGSTGSSGGSGLSADMTEMKYTPTTWTAKAGQATTITAKNSGTVIHDWIVRGMENDTKLEVQPGQSGTKTFTIANAGTYDVYCSQAGHEAAGMKGTLTVQ